jgi:hypothetical protein
MFSMTLILSLYQGENIFLSLWRVCGGSVEAKFLGLYQRIKSTMA